MPVLTTIALWLYFVALDLLVGATIVALNARLRATGPHRALLTRVVRVVPWSLLATAAFGTGALLLIRARFGDTAAGSTLPVGLADRTTLPRLLHVLLAATAVTGLFLAQAALRLRLVDRAFGAWLVRHGIAWTVLSSLLNLLVGAWWFARLPYDTFIRFTGANVPDMLAFVIAIVSALLALGFAAMSATVPDPRRYVHAATTGFAVTLAAMVSMREALRPAAPTTPSRASLIVVALLAAIGLLVLAKAWRSFLQPSLAREAS